MDKFPDESPYYYTGNNPIVYIDPNGMDWYSTTDSNGVVSYFWDGILNKKTADKKLTDLQTYLGVEYTISNPDGNNILLMEGGDWDYIVGDVPEISQPVEFIAALKIS